MSRVFVVPRADFFGGDWPQGFAALPEPDRFLEQARARGRFVERAAAECDPSSKQWIPYCVLRCGSSSPNGCGDDTSGVFLVQRTKAQSEVRLHEAWSIGIGGHVEPIDVEPAAADGAAFFATALARELEEELSFAEPLPPPRLCGLVNDDSTEVGRVHAGLVYAIDLPEPLNTARERVGIREISKMRGAFASLVEVLELWQDPRRFESWSRFVIESGVVGAMGGRSWNGLMTPEDPTGRCSSTRTTER